MTIRTKIIFPFVLAIIVVIAIASYLFYSFSVNNLGDETSAHLETAVQSRSNHIDSLLEEQKEKVRIAAINSELTNEKLNEIKSLQEEFYEVFVLDSNGEIIASSNESQIGKDKSNDDYFINGKEGTYVKDAYKSETTGKNSFAIATPYNEGVLVARIETAVIDKITLDRVGLGETGEIYLINNEGYLITPSRFREDTFLKVKVDSINARDCLGMLENLGEENTTTHEEQMHEGHEASTVFYDYMGINVLGSHYPLREMNWCLLAEIDESEVLTSANRMLWFTIIGGIIVMFIFSIIAYLISRMISKPIIALHEGTEIIEKGNLDYKVGTDSKDEIGQLARAFDKMTGSIKASHAEVDRKVKEQTKDIWEKESVLEDQQKAVLNILEDVEEEKSKVTIEKDRIDAILHSIGDAVFVVDDKFEIIMFNEIAGNVSGFSKEEAIGKRYDKVLRFVYEENDKINDKFIKEAYSTGEIKDMANHTLLIKKDGRKIPVADSAAPLKNKEGKVIGCVVVFRDVTKEREVAEMKDEFLSVASHELRTPMTAIKGFIDMVLKEQVGKLPTRKMREYLELAYVGNDRLIKLVNDMLNVSRIEAGRMKFNLESVQIELLIDQLTTEFHNLCVAKMTYLKFDKPKKPLPKVLVDPDKVYIVLTNLVGNAIKFTNKGGVTLTAKQEGDEVIIAVKDTGAGIDKADQDMLFKKFTQIDASLTREKGTGLGLYIVKMIVGKLGGRVWVDSEGKGKGSTFSFSLPIKGSKAAKMAHANIRRESIEHKDQK